VVERRVGWEILRRRAATPGAGQILQLIAKSQPLCGEGTGQFSVQALGHSLLFVPALHRRRTKYPQSVKHTGLKLL
jgi:hypothetical protein